MGLTLPRALWKRILLGAASLILLFTLAGFLLPAKARVERAERIRSSPQSVHQHIATLRRWPEWSAWTTARFPDMTTRFEGPESGVGAVMIARGKSSGDGTVRITRAEPNEGMWYELDYDHGAQIFRGVILYEPSGDGLRVAWSLETDMGLNPFKRW